jgi:drug/metabolite transporter (DMT)-like permease
MIDVTTGARPRALPTFYTPLALSFSFLWASAFIAVKTALHSTPPLFLMGFRFMIAGGLLLLFARVRGEALPSSGRAWWRLAVLGLLNHALYLGISAIALQTITGSTGAILASTNPLMVAVAAAVVLHERQPAIRLAGFAVAFASVVLVMGARAGIGDPPGGMVLVLIANACMVAATILFKRWAPGGSLAMLNGVQLLVSSVALLAVSFLVEAPAQTVQWDATFLLPLAYLIVFVSWGAVLIWIYLLRAGDAARASAFLFLNPVIGLFLGALFLGEPLRAIDFLGAVGVAAGIYLVQRARPATA